MTLHRNARTCPASRRLIGRRVLEEGWTLTEAAEAAGVSVQRAREWVRRARAGDCELADRGSGPRGRPPGRVGPEREAVIAELRGEVRMNAVEIAEALGMSERTVRAVVSRLGLSKLPPLEEPEPANRYERPLPGELIHIDIKKLGRFGRIGHRITGDRTGQSNSRGIGWEFVHVCVDDASRLAFCQILPDEKKSSAVTFLHAAVGYYQSLGVTVARVMTDNGSCYRAFDFHTACRDLGIRHIRTRPYRPKTNGKAERFIQTALREWAYAQAYPNSDRRAEELPIWLHRYNWHRPHGSL